MSGLNDADAAILAGGLGSRLRPIVANRQKVIALVGNRPFLSHLLDRLSHAGLRRVVLCIGYLGAQVREFFGDAYAHMQLLYSEEEQPLGTGGALRLALPFFKSDPVLVLNGDSFCDVDFADLWNWHAAQQADATVTVVEVPDAGRFGRVTFDERDAITGFAEKTVARAGGWINAGIYVISRAALITIPEKRAVSLERDLFPSWIHRKFRAYRCYGRFLDIGTPESYAAAEAFFFKTPRDERGR